MRDDIFILVAFAILIWGLSRLPGKKRDTSKYSFEYDEEGNPVMVRKYFNTKEEEL